MEAWAIILHFEFNGEDISVWPRGARNAYETKELCRPHERKERALWAGKWPAPTSVVCEKIKVDK